MSVIKLFAEFHSGRRRPNLEIYLNNDLLQHTEEYCCRANDYQENIILSIPCVFKDHNKLAVVMKDKTDSDLVMKDDTIIDHLVIIREVEIDGIPLETVLNHCCSFRHSMPDSWVEHMRSRGVCATACGPKKSGRP